MKHMASYMLVIYIIWLPDVMRKTDNAHEWA